VSLPAISSLPTLTATESKTNMNALSRTRAAARLLRSSPSSVATPAVLRSYASQAQEADPQLADYPRLPWVSRQALPPKGWWDPQMRRNFGDTVRPSPVELYLKILKISNPVSRKRRYPWYVGSRRGSTPSKCGPSLVLNCSRGLRLLRLPGEVRPNCR
jgi:hypothetical protein